MLIDLPTELSKLGLSVNAKKCKIQCSKARPQGDSKLKAGHSEIPIVSRDDGFQILGTTFTLNGSMDVELQRRQDVAWGKFHESLIMKERHIFEEASAAI